MDARAVSQRLVSNYERRSEAGPATLNIAVGLNTEGYVMRGYCQVVWLTILVVSTIAAEWWEEELAQQEEQIVAGEATQAAAGKALWTAGYIEVVGEAACDMDVALSEADCYVSARRAAIVLAQEKLSEMVNGIVIDSETTLKNELLKSSVLRTQTYGLIRGAEIFHEDKATLGDGSILARVWMRLPLHGEDGLSGTVLEHAAAIAAERPVPAFEFSRTPVETQFTGIIVDATEIEAQPAMAPKLLVLEELEAALSVECVDLSIASEQGMVAYAGTLEDARALHERIGEGPLVVTAVATYGSTASDLVVSSEDGAVLAEADPESRLVKACRVVFAGKSFL